MKQHSLSEFYLEKFIDIESVNIYKKTPCINIFYKENKIWKRKSPNNFAKRSDMYSFVDDDKKINHIIERKLSEVEGETAQIYSNKFEKYKLISQEQKVAMATFMSLLFYRTEYFIDNEDRHFKIVDEIIEVCDAKFNGSSMKYTEKFIELYKEKMGRDFPDWFSAGDFIADVKNGKFNKRTKLGVLFDPDKINGLASVFYKMDWTVSCSTSNCFVTSDFPITIVNCNSLKNILGKKVLVFFPVSPKLFLVLSWKSPGGYRYLSATDKSIRLFNKHIMTNAPNLIISSTINFPGSNELMDLNRRSDIQTGKLNKSK